MKRHDYGELFDYGLKDGILVHIDEVANGLGCNCKCPECDEDLVAHNNPKNIKESHFQHKSKSECKHYHETVLHFLAKQIIEETKTLAVPDVQFLNSVYAREYAPGTRDNYFQKAVSCKLTFQKVVLEKSQGDFRPDLICFVTNEKKIIVEIAVTHFVDHLKLRKIHSRDIPVLEIDLSDYNRNTQKQKLKEILSGNIHNMKWLHNKKMEDRESLANCKSEPIKEFVESNIKRLKVYGRNQNIYNCPIKKDKYDLKNVDDHCEKCKYFVELKQYALDLSVAQPKYPSYFIECIGHKSIEYNKLFPNSVIQTDT